MRDQTILIVDDEEKIRSLVASYLRDDGYGVREAETGEAAVDATRQLEPDLIILDVRMPGIDGFETLRRIRQFSDVYVIMLTARSEETDKVIGLEVGADDYLTKPFSPRELAARVKAVMRRGRNTARVDSTLVFSGLTIDPDRRQVLIDSAPIELTALEFDLLAALASAPGRVFTRRQLIDRVWGWDFFGEERIVDVHIRNIRKALDDPAEKPQFIGTVRGVGYRFLAEQR
ncbi:MAG: response regulator transcription factor [Acidimicrobiia bacterium]|nr:response regulator transcription factor [Acidimicrobiia bacterium]NNF11174.1 response regulator transcription factor [Acidimicrobiia bacterium]NNL71442.1 response regulator transcription factor [Acidimicrobiia bacterium]